MKYYGYIILAMIIFIVDRVTKLWALTYCIDFAYTLNQFLSFEVVFNRGISWGMFHSPASVTFGTVSVIIGLITAFFCYYTYYNYLRGYSVVAEVCIVSGSLCNLIDRVFYKGVIDFIILSYADMSWPVFNVADIAIVIGVGILIFQLEE